MIASRLGAAFDRVNDFLAIQGQEISVEAVTLLQEAVGVDDDARALIRDRVDALVKAGHSAAAGSVLLGVILGLFAAEPDG